MELKLSLFIVLLSVISLVIITNMIRKEKLGLKYALSWMIMAIFIMIMAIIPRFIIVIANLLGVATPINAVFFTGFIFSLAIIFSLTVALSRTSNKVTKLTQELALLKKKLEE